MRNTAKKGQLEIMGLIVIVILLTLAMFFILSFRASNNSDKDIRKTYDDDQLASNFIIAFLKTSTGCQKYTMENMIQDCAVEKRIYCENKPSCIYLNDTISELLDKTLDEWGQKYEFRIDEFTTPIIFQNNCTEGDEGDAAFQPISLYPYPGTVVVKIHICER